MNNTNSYSYIRIGLYLRMLANVNTSFTKSFFTKELNTLKSILVETELTISCSNMESSFFKDMESELNKLEDEDLINSNLCSIINKEMMILERHVYSEGKTKTVHLIPERRFNSTYLLTKQEKLFMEGIFNKLPTLAQSDIRSSCKCLLFGEATASAFHILRATEDILKSYYFHHIRQNRLSKPMWAQMIVKLKAKNRNKPPLTLLNSLDLIREAYRNPTQHPDATYDIDSVQDLMGLCIDVINKMGTEL
jgi:hypothetical protein